MNLKALLASATIVLALAAAAPAQANTYIYVGSWEVDDGPSWTVVPSAYTGQEAAALLFGGSSGNYAISTNGSSPTDINFDNWVSTYDGACGGAFPCGTIVSDTLAQSTGGLYASPGDTSAYVTDWAVGSAYTNYAFVSATPLPSTWTMLIAGFVGLGFFAYRGTKKRSAAGAGA